MGNCKYCGKESYGRPFCPECGKKYFGFTEPLTIKSNNKTATKPKTSKQTNLEKTQQQIEFINSTTNDIVFDLNKLKKYNIKNKPNLPKATHQEARIYQCKNGNKVRSKSEREISDFLTEHQIKHEYEKPIRISKYQYVHPDFYIPGIITHTGRIVKNIFIEHLGGPMSKDPEKIQKYLDNNSKKFSHYERMKLTVLCTYEDDIINPNESLKQKLLKIEENKINY